MPRDFQYVIYAALGSLLLVGASLPPKDSRQVKIAYEASHSLPIENSYEAYADYKSNNCYFVKDHDAADLCAQWRAVAAAEKALEMSWYGNLVAGIGAVLSFIGIILVIAALKQTERSLAESKNNNIIATMTARRQLRAYIGAIDFRIEGFAIGKYVKSTWRIKNFGATPAFDVRIVAWPFITDSREKVRFDRWPTLSKDIQPGEENDIPYNWHYDIDQFLETSFQNDSLRFIYAGIISYRDAFGIKHYTTFKKKIVVQSIDNQTRSGTMINCGRGNRSN